MLIARAYHKQALEKKIINRIVKPTLNALKRKKHYTGFLYVGLMIKNNEPYLIEFNVRMGDPECQVILPRLKTDLLKIINYSTQNKLKNIRIKWSEEKCMTVVLCSKGYPGKYKKNIEIEKLEKIKKDKKDFIFHAGTQIKDGKLSYRRKSFKFHIYWKESSNVRRKIIKMIKKLNWKNGFTEKILVGKSLAKDENYRWKI